MAKTMEEVLERFRTIEFHDDFDMIVAIANGGIVPAGIINQRLQKEVHLLRINLRDEYQHPKYDAPQLLAPVDFNFKGKSILLVDDRIKTGATIKLARELYNPQIQISAESETKRSIFREKDKTKRSKKESAQHSKSRNKSFVMTSVSAL